MSLLFFSLPCSAFLSICVEKEEESKVHRQRKGQTAVSAAVKEGTGALIEVVALLSLDQDGSFELHTCLSQLH